MNKLSPGCFTADFHARPAIQVATVRAALAGNRGHPALLN